MPRSDIILFCDLETTGVDRDLDDIIEVGISVVTWPAFEEVFAKNYVLEPRPSAYARMQAEDEVREMHRQNGLQDEVDAIIAAGYGYNTPELADRAIDADLSQFGSRGSAHIPVGGSGFSHFDRPFIRKSLPLFDSRISYWCYDVGVMRRMFILAGAVHADDSGKTHRALDDARVHAQEFKFYMDRITEMFGSLRAEADAK